MTLPRTIVIRPHRIPVVLDRTLEPHGEYRPRPPTIVISDNGTGAYSVLLHEAIHAIDDQFGLNLSERTVRVLETALANLIIDNPALIRGLQGMK